MRPSSLDTKPLVAAEAACESGDEDRFSEACRHENDVSLELALTPCASDAEFLEKLKYLLARDICYYSDPDSRVDFGYTLIAIAQHFGLATVDDERAVV